jgi:Rps23 Pro-64 3,4-dihydroxylase Tpa1-like proline 4-hydroxylase
MQEELINLIINRLNESKEQLKKQFCQKHPIKVARHFALDNLLPTEIAHEIHANFPKPNKMRMLNSFGELKLKYSHIKHTSKLLQDFHVAIQNPNVIAQIEEITEIKNQLPDTSRLAGGVSALLKGYYINPHLDNSHDIDKKFYRTVNLLYYASPDWKLENGGNYELWDEEVNNRIIVPSFFNRLVVMETNTTSWHAVNSVLCNTPRLCIFNYYFSEKSPENREYFHTASSLFFNPLIKARPEQKVRRAFGRARDQIKNLFSVKNIK